MLSHTSRVRLNNLLDCGLPGFSVHRIFQARYWSGLPFSSPRVLPNPGMAPVSLVSPALADGFFKTVALGKPTIHLTRSIEDSQAYRSRQ